MKLIVADAGPLIVLGRSGLLPATRTIVGEIIVPETVFGECTAFADKPGAIALQDARRHGIITIHPDPQHVTGLGIHANIDAGESAAIALALQLQGSVLMDDQRGRAAARMNHIDCIGSAGILLTGKQRGLFADVGAILLQWKSFGYFLSSALTEEVLARAGERRPPGL